MVLKKTVRSRNTSVTEVYLTLVTVPWRVSTLLLSLVPAVPATTTGCRMGLFILPFYRKVKKGEGSWRSRVTIVPFLRMVISNQALQVPIGIPSVAILLQWNNVASGCRHLQLMPQTETKRYTCTICDIWYVRDNIATIDRSCPPHPYTSNTEQLLLDNPHPPWIDHVVDVVPHLSHEVEHWWREL